MKHGDPRPSIIGPDSGPEEPYPLRLEGPVVKGFGRGSKELGIPTANIPISGLDIAGHKDLVSGVYFGYCSLSSHLEHNATSTDPASNQPSSNSRSPAKVYDMVMSVGWNPYYKNTKRSVEVHVMHDFEKDFYDSHMKVLILGFVRDELDYVSKEALIEDIETDIEVTRKSLDREAWRTWTGNEWLRGT